MGALDYLPAIALGSKASEITGASNDAFIATGYASLIQSLTGEPPRIVALPGRKAQVLLNQKQIEIMKLWLERQVSVGIKIAKSPSNLELVTGPFVLPVVLKYAVPLAIVLIAAGWMAHKYIGR